MMQNVVESIFADDWYMNVKDMQHLDEKIVWEIV